MLGCWNCLTDRETAQTRHRLACTSKQIPVSKNILHTDGVTKPKGKLKSVTITQELDGKRYYSTLMEYKKPQATTHPTIQSGIGLNYFIYKKWRDKMIEKIVALTDEYKKTNKKSVRKSKGQFFTSLNTAKYMAAKAARETERLSILDPGCGNALLAAAVIEHCIQNKKCFHFDVTLVENDEAVMDVLSKSIAIIKQYVSENNGSVHFTLTRENFITFPLTCKFDIVISNPPYLKLRKDSKEALCMQHVLYGQPNLYGLFMAKAIDALKEKWSVCLYYA